jgi:hypothetical protein
MSFLSNLNPFKPRAIEKSRSQNHSAYDYGGNTFEGQSREHAKVFEKAIELYKEQNSTIANTRFVMGPNFGIYASMYGTVDAWADAVNFKASAIPKWGMFDWAEMEKDEGKRKANILVTKEVERRAGLTNIIQKASKGYSNYGTTFYVIFKSQKAGKLYKVIPASETLNYIVNLDSFMLDSLSWNDGRIWNYKTLPRINKQTGKPNYHVGVVADSDDQIFGTPPPRALFTIFDGKLRDDENYMLFLKNASFPGIMALVPNDATPSEIANIESALRSMRDPDTKFKGSVIKAIGEGKGGEAFKRVEFTTVEQRLDNRMTVEEKREIDDKAKDALGIPRGLFAYKQGGGLGSNENEVAMVQLKNYCLDPHTALIKKDLDSLFIPDILEDMERDGFFQQVNVKIRRNGMDKQPTAKDFTFDFYPVQIELPSAVFAQKSENKKTALQAYSQKVITAQEMRDELEIETPEELKDKFQYLISPNSIITEPINEVETKQENEVTDIDDSDTSNDGGDLSKKDDENKPDDNLQTIQKSISPDEVLEYLKSNTHKYTSKKKDARFFVNKINNNENSNLPELLQSSEANMLKTKIKEALDKQSKSIDINSILKKVDLKKIQKQLNLKEKAIDPESPELRSELEKVIGENIDPLDTHLIVEELIATMIFYARLGMEEGNRQALNAGVDVLTPEQIGLIRTQVLAWVNDRTQNLMGLQSGNTDGQITNPFYQGNLNQTSIALLAGSIVSLLNTTQTTDIDKLTSAFDSSSDERNTERARLITENNLAMVYGLGLFLAANALKAQTKTWMKSTAINKRDYHLAIVGETVPINAPFSIGDYWTNIEPNCQCSIKLGWTTKI